MTQKALNQFLGILAVLALILSNLQSASAQPTASPTGAAQPVATNSAAALDPNKLVRVIVQLSDPASASYRGGQVGYRATSPKSTGSKTLDVASPDVASYESYLRGQQTQFVNSLRAAMPTAAVQRSFQTVLNGLVVELRAGQIDALRGLPGVLNVTLEQAYQPQMDASLPLIGLGSGTLGGLDWTDAGLWQTLGGHQNAGKGIKVADIDTGITPSNPCFAPAGFTMPAGFPKGESAVTNAKIIAARSYYRASDPPVNAIGAVDDPGANGGGHGTHTAGTIVCNYGTTTTLAGIQISGVAPAAQLLVYKVFYKSQSGSGSAFTPELVAAIEDAVRDGADVVNNSWGGGNNNTVNDPEVVAYEGAVDAGVVVVFSAGNSGPGTYTLGNPGANSEKFITVAASTTARTFNTTLENTVRSDSGTLLPAITGVSLTQTSVEAPIVDLELAGYASPIACSALPSGYATGKIVVVQRGNCSLSIKADAVKAGGGVGVVIRNVPSGLTTLPLIFYSLPTVHLSLTDGEALKAYLAALPGGVSATFRINGPAVANPAGDTADTIADFSSVGPNLDLRLKPDIAAPGVNILSSFAPDALGSTTPTFEFLQGTSMAAPHVTGAAALMKQAHPNWTPAQIRSALMSSAAEPASLGDDPTVRGAGRLDLTRPDKAALTFDHPSLSFQLAQIGVAKAFTVTAKNTTALSVTYSAGTVANAAAGVVFKVNGTTASGLTVPANSTATFSLELTGLAAGPAYGEIYFFDASAPATHLLHLPYYALVTANLPANDVYLLDGDSSPANACADYAQVYKDALTAAGLSYTYVDLAGSAADFIQARRHKWVLYFENAGPCGGWLSSNPSADLKSYLYQGGKMWIMGQDIATREVGLGDPLNLAFHFGASYRSNNLFASPTPLQALGDGSYSPFVAGMTLPLDASNTTSADELRPSFYTDMDTVPVFSDPDAPAAIGTPYKGALGARASSEPTVERVKHTQDWTGVSFRTLFTSFGLHNILESGGSTYRKDLLVKANAFFMDTLTVGFSQPSYQAERAGALVSMPGSSASSMGSVTQYRVDFGDGTPVAAVAPGAIASLTHVYAHHGNYKAYIEAQDDFGHKAVSFATVNVPFMLALPIIIR